MSLEAVQKNKILFLSLFPAFPVSGCFPEFQKYEGKCRFPDCSHTKEKGCAVIEAVKNGEIAKSRHESYVEMYEQAKQLKEWEYKND